MNETEMFKNLLVMAAADRSFSEEEVTYLSLRAHRLGLSDAEFTAALEHAVAENAAITVPPDRGDRVRLLKELLKMMAADGHVADMERELFAVVAARMDIAEDELNKLIDDVK